MRTEVIPERFPQRAVLQESALAAASNLEMSSRLAVLRVVLDAPEFEVGGFWQIESAREGLCAIVYASILDLLTPRAALEHRAADLDEDRIQELATERIDRLRIDRWLHRNLLQLDDLLCKRIDPALLSRRDAAAFQACWDVWTDGRLKALSLPGISLAERRRLFFRTFAERGLLLPRHWKVFHALWDGKLADHEGLIEASRSLPALR
ncbi:MAG TPA: hypothetical protein VKA63_02985 [Candidatus Krumholzibacteria bacterium]|nr:hypothetical protein [Candidatus Krumholzibacteria bacterium]